MPTDYMNLDQKISREELEAFYYEYANTVDEEIERWTSFFTKDCVYKIVTRENYDRGLPLALMYCEGIGMLHDRVSGIQKTSFHAPRYCRHLVSNIRIVGNSESTLHTQANFIVFESLVDSTTNVFNAGRYLDVIIREGSTLKFREKICILDRNLLLGAIIYPI